MPVTSTLPKREGRRPETGPAVPHQQLSQNAPVGLQEQLWARMHGLDGVRTGGSGVSLPDTRALHLDPALARGPREAFLVGTEFAHLHGAADGSLHLALPPAVVTEVLEQGWGEPHPLAGKSYRNGGETLTIPDTNTMLFGPRDELELEIIWLLVRTSYEFARGGR